MRVLFVQTKLGPAQGKLSKAATRSTGRETRPDEVLFPEGGTVPRVPCLKASISRFHLWSTAGLKMEVCAQ